MLGNYCLEVLLGGCTVPPKPPSPTTEPAPSCKGSGLVARSSGYPRVCLLWALGKSIRFGGIPYPHAWRVVFGLQTPQGKFRIQRKIKENTGKNTARLCGNFPPDGKLWKSHVHARMSVSMFSSQCGHAYGIRTARGTRMRRQARMLLRMQMGTGIQTWTMPGMQMGTGMVKGMQAEIGMQAGVSTLQPGPSSSLQAAAESNLCLELLQVPSPGQAATLSPSCCGLSPCPMAVVWRARASG